MMLGQARRLRHALDGIPARWAIAPVIGIAVTITVTTVLIWDHIWFQRGTDWAFYLIQARRFLDGGGFYEPHQLAGAYSFSSGVDNVYPPPALLLFLPFVVLPGPLWWIVPLGILAAVVVSYRPAPWAWPLIAICCLAPRTQQIVMWGNTTMWIAAFVGLGLRFSWPSVLVLVKPLFAPLALIGFRRRSWLLGLAGFGVVNVVMLAMWVEYVGVWRNAGRTWPSLGYAPADAVMVSIPIIAWLARRQQDEAAA